MIEATKNTVLVKVLYQKESGGIIIPDGAEMYRQYHGYIVAKVVSVGSEYPNKELVAGDKVLFRRHEGIKIFIGGVEYVSLKEKWVVAKVEESL